MTYENILYEKKGPTAWITLNRPKAMNALSTTLISELCKAIKEAEVDAEVHVVVIKGAGEKAFSAGADLQELQPLKIRGAFDYSRSAHRAFSTIEQCSKPVIACVNGLAIGGGAELALSCHMRLASEKTKMGFPESGLGGIPGMGGTQRLPRLIGKSAALPYLLSGEMIKADEGNKLGLFFKVFSVEELDKGAASIAESLAKKSPLALKLIIQAVTNGTEGNLEEGLVLEAALMAALKNSEDAQEGLKALFEKREPQYTGE